MSKPTYFVKLCFSNPLNHPMPAFTLEKQLLNNVHLHSCFFHTFVEIRSLHPPFVFPCLVTLSHKFLRCITPKKAWSCLPGWARWRVRRYNISSCFPIFQVSNFQIYLPVAVKKRLYTVASCLERSFRDVAGTRDFSCHDRGWRKAVTWRRDLPWVFSRGTVGHGFVFCWIITRLVGGLEHFIFSHILGMVIPID